MRLLSVNVGRERSIGDGKVSGKTGIDKRPVDRPVQVTSNGLTGDRICDTENHGGVDQAVYVYGVPDYAWWSETLGRELPPGTFGENLTITELESADVFIGDRLLVGAVILEVTAPRIPCATLAARMEEPTFVKRFRRAERPGVYCRVIQEGKVRAGDPVTLEGYRGETISVIEMFRDFFEPNTSEATIRRHLAAPVAVRDRVARERELGELLARKSGSR
jgi:MOSC domain-containing protein YiiM